MGSGGGWQHHTMGPGFEGQGRGVYGNYAPGVMAGAGTEHFSPGQLPPSARKALWRRH